MTTDLQRMHQDEFVAALRSGDYTQIPGQLCGDGDRERCVAGVAVELAGSSYVWYSRLGMSVDMAVYMVRLNNGGPSGQRFFGEGHLTFDEIADWFKVERDAHDGDLSDWTAS